MAHCATSCSSSIWLYSIFCTREHSNMIKTHIYSHTHTLWPCLCDAVPFFELDSCALRLNDNSAYNQKIFCVALLLHFCFSLYYCCTFWKCTNLVHFKKKKVPFICDTASVVNANMYLWKKNKCIKCPRGWRRLFCQQGFFRNLSSVGEKTWAFIQRGYFM